ncbi:MAG: phosphate acetyltransferase [Mariprofundaceae bacterium]|nr:phosphate acetyltransferase [Mariprofundaceae bacterium]
MNKHAFFLVSHGAGTGLTTVCLGMVRALDQLGIRTGFCKPIAQQHYSDNGTERSTHLVQQISAIKPPQPIALQRAEAMLSDGREGQLLEEVIACYRQSMMDNDVVVIEGLVADSRVPFAAKLNSIMAQAMDAEVILVANPSDDLDAHIEYAASAFSEDHGTSLIGIILNVHDASSPRAMEHLCTARQKSMPVYGSDHMFHVNQSAEQRTEQNSTIPLIGSIPYADELHASRTSDIADFVQARVLHAGDITQRRVRHIALCGRTLANTLSVYTPDSLLIVPGDRDDVFVAACMSAMNGVPLAGILLTSGLQPSDNVMKLCQLAMQTGLPVLQVADDSYTTASLLSHMPNEVASDDVVRMEHACAHVARHLNTAWLKTRCALHRKRRLSPAAFRYQLLRRASRNMQRIVLPEGEEPRTILAAQQCQQRGIAHGVLLGSPERIQHIAAAHGLVLDDALTIIDPATVRDQYIDAMVSLRQHKGLTAVMAADQLQDSVVLGTMMLACGDVDGLVSGALHTTANTVRPALQLIGACSEGGLVSSIFFMCLPDQMVVYGDCAINPNPDAEQLAQIAMQSADSAQQFGLDPRVAMISYSTGDSGSGNDVEKVRRATAIAQGLRPDMIIDGPLQYDAASTLSVGKSKAPSSNVAGQANVFIFPDLNTGNTTYKAVQRSAHVVSMGPMLQGLKKPVNDLSRGASEEDIVYTIALTAIQATQQRP